MPIPIKRPAKQQEEKTVLNSVIENQIAEATKLDTTDYTYDSEKKAPVKKIESKHKEKSDVINLKYPEGTTQRVKSFYTSLGHNMTSGFIMSFELTVELVEKGIISFSKGGYRILERN